MVIEHIIDALSYDVFSLFDSFPGSLANEIEAPVDRGNDCLLLDCASSSNNSANENHLSCAEQKQNRSNKSSKRCSRNEGTICSKSSEMTSKSSAKRCKETRITSKRCSKNSGKKSANYNKNLNTTPRGGGCGLWSRIHYKFNEFFWNKNVVKDKMRKSCKKSTISSKCGQLPRRGTTTFAKKQSACPPARCLSKHPALSDQKSSSRTCSTSRNTCASSSAAHCSHSTASSLSSVSATCSSDTCSSSSSSAARQNCEILAQVLCESLDVELKPKLKKKTYYFLCKEDSEGIEQRASHLYEACQRRRGSKKFPAFENLKHWQKLAYYWAAISHEPLCESPFENFVRSLAEREDKNPKQAQSTNFQIYANNLWSEMCHKDRLGFVIEALMALISGGKVDMFDDEAVDQVWAQLKKCNSN